MGNRPQMLTNTASINGTCIQMPLKWDGIVAAGNWLNENMPNPPLPEPQRYSIYNARDGGVYIEFANEQDAIMFSLSCSH